MDVISGAYRGKAWKRKTENTNLQEKEHVIVTIQTERN
jgi:hypothetical protein